MRAPVWLLTVSLIMGGCGGGVRVVPPEEVAAGRFKRGDHIVYEGNNGVSVDLRVVAIELPYVVGRTSGKELVRLNLQDARRVIRVTDSSPGGVAALVVVVVVGALVWLLVASTPSCEDTGSFEYCR